MLLSNILLVGDNMPALTFEQVEMLNKYRIYTTPPKRALFTLERLSKEFFHDDFAPLMQGITDSKNATAAVSHFAKRYGMFFAMQFHMLAAYDLVWDGKFIDLQFDVTEEFGTHTVAMFINPNDYRYVIPEERQYKISSILYYQGYEIVQQLRKTTTISPLTIWENFFIHMINIFDKLLENPATATQAMDDIELLENPELWKRFSDKSLFYEFTKGKNPSQLASHPKRKSCCFSMDIPGLAACGYCPRA
ncbi:Fe-S oxidoreductase [Lysinibacillus telephonicus]|nr:Fe-S oxidoreductase [Lysinibacillus telephonicus]